MSFQFDQTKSDSNKAKHGIDFVEVQALWLDQRRREIPTRRGLPDEERWAVIGSLSDRMWTVIVTYRDDAIRIISARQARANEAKLYGRDENDQR